MQLASFSPRRLAMAGAVTLLVALALLGTVFVPRPVGQARGTTTTATTLASGFSSSQPKMFYVQINCGEVAVCVGGFMPQILTIPQGSMITWTSRENPELYVYHRVVFRVGGIDSGQMNGEETFTATLLSQGVYQYYDADFPGNNGTIIVVPSNSTGG